MLDSDVAVLNIEDGPGIDEGITPRFELSRIMLVGLTNAEGKLVYRGQSAPNGPWEAAWAPIEPKGQYKAIGGGRTTGGQVAVVAVAKSDGAVWYVAEAKDQSSGKEAWDAPISIGAPAGHKLTNVQLALMGDGRLSCFALDNQGRVFWKHENPCRIVTKTERIIPPGSTTPITIEVQVKEPPEVLWNAHWYEFEATPNQIISFVTQPDAEDFLNLFAVTEIGKVYQKCQNKHGANSLADWDGWKDVSLAQHNIDKIASGLDSSGAINLFGLDHDGTVLRRRQAPGDRHNWDPWSYLAKFGSKATAIAVGLELDGDLAVVVRTKDDWIRATMQNNAVHQHWENWTPVTTAATNGQLWLTYSADGRLYLFYQDGASPGAVGFVHQTEPQSTEWGLEWTWLGTIAHMDVVRDLTPPKTV